MDCFPYNGEPIVELRLATVYPYVDEIVVTESRTTFSGVKKQSCYFYDRSSVFDKYRDKITFIRTHG